MAIDSGAESDLASARRELTTLYAALDHVHSGLLILDGELRAVYSNPVLHRIFQSFSAAEIRSGRHHYVDLLKAAFVRSAVDLDDYIAKRLNWVRSGDPTPMDLKMSNGTVMRCHLAVLPHGGRMLIYSDVTDIVRQSEALERLATTDGMTGIYNRRHFMTLADIEWNKACRYGRALSLLLVDIDFFKSINDTFGHQIGDKVIIHMARLANSSKRVPDVLARIGGEEFALLLPETDLQQAYAVAERLREQVAVEPLVDANRTIRATVSIGVATRSQQTAGIDELFGMADRALYDAKRAGRNHAVCFSSETDRPDSDHKAAELTMTA